MIRTPYAVLTVLRVRQKWKLFVNKIKKARIVSGQCILISNTTVHQIVFIAFRMGYTNNKQTKQLNKY